MLFAIASGEPPQLDAPETFSAPFRDVVAAALTRDMEQRPVSGELLKHPFLAAAQRGALLALAARALHCKHNPKPPARSDQEATLRRSESDDTLQRDDGTLQRDDGTMANGDGTFCADDTGGGTFCARGSEGGTLGGTFCAADTVCGTFCAADTVDGNFCAAGSTAGGASCAYLGAFGADSAETGGTLRAGSAELGGGALCADRGGALCADPASTCTSSTVSAADSYHTAYGEPAWPPHLSRESSAVSPTVPPMPPVVRAVSPTVPPMSPVARLTHGVSMDDSQLNLGHRSRARLAEGEDEAGSAGAPPHLPRAASDDALFERAVGRFDAAEGKRRPQPFASTGGEALPGERTAGAMRSWGAEPDANANCTIS